MLNYTHEEATSAFESGKTAMWYDATALVPWLEDPKRSQVVGKVGYARDRRALPAAAACWPAGTWRISPDSKNKECAWAFIMYMTSKENAKTYVANGGVPGRTSSLKDPEFQAKNPSAEAQLAGVCARPTRSSNAGLHWIPPTPVLGKLLDRIGYYGTLPLAEGHERR